VETVHAVAIVATLAVLVAVLELVRRRRLVERYALLWMVTAVAMLVLALLRDDLLNPIADLLGIAAPVNLLFLAGFAVVFLLVLNFSVAISRLSEETKILAQEVARLDQELRAARDGTEAPDGIDVPNRDPSSPVKAGEQPAGGGPVRPEDGSK
jgi:hypothetical protein